MKTKYNWMFWLALAAIVFLIACICVPEMEESLKDSLDAPPSTTNSATQLN